MLPPLDPPRFPCATKSTGTAEPSSLPCGVHFTFSTNAWLRAACSGLADHARPRRRQPSSMRASVRLGMDRRKHRMSGERGNTGCQAKAARPLCACRAAHVLRFPSSAPAAAGCSHRPARPRSRPWACTPSNCVAGFACGPCIPCARGGCAFRTIPDHRSG